MYVSLCSRPAYKIVHGSSVLEDGQRGGEEGSEDEVSEEDKEQKYNDHHRDLDCQ